MQKPAFILLFLILSAGLAAQYSINPRSSLLMPTPLADKHFSDRSGPDSGEDRSWARFQLQTGMIFNNFNGLNTTSSYISPTVSLPVSSRFRFHAGMALINTFSPGYTEFPGRHADLFAFGTAVFSVNEKLSLYGQYARSLLITSQFNTENLEIMTLGMDFHPAPGFSIGASFSSYRGIDPFYNNFGYRIPYGHRLPVNF